MAWEKLERSLRISWENGQPRPIVSWDSQTSLRPCGQSLANNNFTCHAVINCRSAVAALGSEIVLKNLFGEIAAACYCRSISTHLLAYLLSQQHFLRVTGITFLTDRKNCEMATTVPHLDISVDISAPESVEAGARSGMKIPSKLFSFTVSDVSFKTLKSMENSTKLNHQRF